MYVIIVSKGGFGKKIKIKTSEISSELHFANLMTAC